MRRLLVQPWLVVVVGLSALLAAGCGPTSYETVNDLFAAAGGEEWCDGELIVSFEPFVGNCGDPTTDSRVILGVGDGGEELRTSIDAARQPLAEDDQVVLVPSSPDQGSAWQLRSRDRSLLEEAQERLGGVILDSEQDIDDWLDQ